MLLVQCFTLLVCFSVFFLLSVQERMGRPLAGADPERAKWSMAPPSIFETSYAGESNSTQYAWPSSF